MNEDIWEESYRPEYWVELEKKARASMDKFLEEYISVPVFVRARNESDESFRDRILNMPSSQTHTMHIDHSGVTTYYPKKWEYYG